MAVQIITLEDLAAFKTALLQDLKELLNNQKEPEKKWLKSKEVRTLLNISPGTLQTHRINGTLTYTKIGGILYYDQADINKLLTRNKVNAIPTLFK
ncbi:helix-turn-helix domain-containing protein [Flavobacterium tegetincola]|uniref:helix-turn-helix domain-containing protein n=1 Tax=Flavobacterium tegetincola TaxID=150172 RepID=UPI0003FBB502|nr:helix-turn-helix domain-containing protein [Flavobacterium tegetincola]